jgi:hypothetical protein
MGFDMIFSFQMLELLIQPWVVAAQRIRIQVVRSRPIGIPLYWLQPPFCSPDIVLSEEALC